jgi:hypothetical protein
MKTMKQRKPFNKIVVTAAVTASLLGGSIARAEDNDALLNLLVKKRIISEKEADQVRDELTKTAVQESKSDSASKLKLSTPVTELELYGDARLRYEVANGQTGRPDAINPPGDTFQRDRFRYRLRIGLRGTLADDWFFGLRLETATNPRSADVTFGDDTSAGPGPFAKNSDSIGVGQAYLGYKGIKGLSLMAGKMPNPLVTTAMVWDGDINPEGIAEQYKYTIKLGGGAPADSETAIGSDGKTVVTKTKPAAAGPTLDLFANFAQFVYDDSNPENPIGPSPDGVPNTDAYLLAWQIGARYNWNKDMYLQLAPTLYNYTGTGDTFNKSFSGDPTFAVTDPVTGVVTLTTPNQTGVNNLLVFDLPTEFGFQVSKLPARIFGDFAVNLNGDERARAAGHPDKTDQNLAYMIGASVGSTKKKGGVSLSAFWQHTEQFALDPNLVDSTFFDSRVNLQGPGVQLGYAFSDAVTATLTYAHAWQIDKDLGTGGVGNIGINPVDDYNVFQADLLLKF